MNSAQTGAASVAALELSAAHQGFGNVLAAEFGRIVKNKLTIITAAVCIVVAVGFAYALYAMSGFGVDSTGENIVMGNPTADGVLSGLSVIGGTLALFFGLYAATFAAREYSSGVNRATLLLVPKRSRLLAARLLLWAALGALVGAVSFVLAYALLVLAGGHGAEVAGDMLVLRAAACVLVCMLACLLACSIGTLLRGGALSVLAFLLAQILLGMLLSILAGILPGVIGEALSQVSSYVFGAATEIMGNATALGEFLGALATAVVWVVVFSLLGAASFRKYNG